MPTFTEWLQPEKVSKTEIEKAKAKIEGVKQAEAQMNKIHIKVEYFKYWIFSLLKRDEFWKQNDFSLLKVQKLLFLTTCASIDNAEEQKTDLQNTLIEVFDNWVAMPYGHVEIDIYNYWKKNEGDFGWFTINQQQTQIKPSSLNGFLAQAKSNNLRITPKNKTMDSGAPKELTIKCKKCNEPSKHCIHWREAVLWHKCSKCDHQNRYELKISVTDWLAMKSFS